MIAGLSTWVQPMFWECLPQVELRITIDEFERLRGLRHPAYKYEYFDGKAVLSPRVFCSRAILRLPAVGLRENAGHRIDDEVRLRVFNAADWPEFGELLAHSAFLDPPLSLLSEPEVERIIAQHIDALRGGEEGGIASNVSCVAEDDGGSMVGAALVTLMPQQLYGRAVLAEEDWPVPHLTWILVGRIRQRRGVGTAMLSHVSRTLSELGCPLLASTFLDGNFGAVQWHWRNGFELLSRFDYSKPLARTIK